MSPVAEKEKQIPARTDERGVLIAGKPNLGIIAIAKKNHQKDEIYQFVGYLKDRLSKEQSIHLMMEEAVLYDEYEIVNRARRMQEEGADLIVLIVGTWIYSSIVVTAALLALRAIRPHRQRQPGGQPADSLRAAGDRQGFSLSLRSDQR